MDSATLPPPAMGPSAHVMFFPAETHEPGRLVTSSKLVGHVSVKVTASAVVLPVLLTVNLYEYEAPGITEVTQSSLNRTKLAPPAAGAKEADVVELAVVVVEAVVVVVVGGRVVVVVVVAGGSVVVVVVVGGRVVV